MSIARVPAALLALAVSFAAPAAHADVSSWYFTGFGPSSVGKLGTNSETRSSLQLDAGVGSSPKASFAVGGLGRMHMHFGGGADWALLARVATGGYVRGNWGLALDAGPYVRTWADGSPGLAGTISIGAPLGITLNLDGARGRDDVTTLAAVIGLDFARFTIYRSTGLNWFPNPYPTPPGRDR